MADIEIGQTFIDFEATNFQGTKPKYFIAMSVADDCGDKVVCFVMNSENYMCKYRLNCNRKAKKFILESGALSFLTNHTSIMLFRPLLYEYDEIMCNPKIKLYEIAPPLLCRQIKNCIDWDYIPLKFACLIKESFKGFSC